jgi:2-dehydro-3-deoxyphosphooctonate aldolase (KDO 8-P synthase)
VTLTSTLFPHQRLTLIAGPCVLEDLDLALEIAGQAASICRELGITYIFKGSYDKANRSSVNAFRGPGLKRGLTILANVKQRLGLPVTTDVHEPSQVDEVAEIVDIIQIPAFLCRHTDLLLAAGRTQRLVNIKKGQFLAPQDMINVVNKVFSTGNREVVLTERGSTFGYHNLIVDFRSLSIMKSSTGCPVVFDATHSVQLPGGLGDASGGDRKMIPVLAAAAIAAGADALFLELHPNPGQALCDGANSLSLDELPPLLRKVSAIFAAINT